MRVLYAKVENEYGGFGYDDIPRDKAYLRSLVDKLRGFGITEMLLTSDSPERTLDWGAVPGGKLSSETLLWNDLELFDSIII